MKLKRKIEHTVSGKFAVLFLISGVLSLIFSFYTDISILALIGLGLTFWGVLFFLLKPVNFVEGSLLYNVALSEYLTIERIINELTNKATGYYMPPIPKDVYLPEFLKGLKTLVVFVSAEKDATIPSIEEMAKGKFISKNPKGLLLTPPGSAILTQIEDKSKLDFTKMELNELCTVLPISILRDLSLAKGMAMEQNGDLVHLKIFDSLYKNLYDVRNILKTVNLLGCPIASAVACALAKTSGKIVTIQKYKVSPDGSTREVSYLILQGGYR